MAPRHPPLANTSKAEPETVPASGSKSAGVGPTPSNETQVNQEPALRRDTHADTMRAGSTTPRGSESARTAPYDPIRDAVGQNERNAVESPPPGVPLYQPPEPVHVRDKGKGKAAVSQSTAEAPEHTDEPGMAGPLRDNQTLDVGGGSKDLSPERDEAPEHGDEETDSNFEPGDAESDGIGEEEEGSDPEANGAGAAPSPSPSKDRQEQTISSSTRATSKEPTQPNASSPSKPQRTPNHTKVQSAMAAEAERLKGYNKICEDLSDEDVEEIVKGKHRRKAKMRDVKTKSYWTEPKQKRRAEQAE